MACCELPERIAHGFDLKGKRTREDRLDGSVRHQSGDRLEIPGTRMPRTREPGATKDYPR